MLKKLLMIFTLLVLILVSATPALADKPLDGELRGNASHQDNGKGNQTGKDNPNPDPARPNSKNDALPAVNEQKISVTNTSDEHGFDEFGYNRTARIFNGTALGWCMEKLGYGEAGCVAYLGDYAYDRLVMKWNAEWDRGNDEDWAYPPYAAWENNQWNGKGPGGSGEVWHYKIVWVGDCEADPTLVPEGGYCIWDQFATLADHGTADGVHTWLTHAIPNGYGSYR